MGNISIDQILVTPLKRITTEGGDVLHAIKISDPGFEDFGEAYFSLIENGAIKAWKKHIKMTLNLIVPIGKVKFVFTDNSGNFRYEIIGEGRYSRLTVPPGIWFGFEGIFSPKSLVLNVADFQHDSQEIERKKIDEIIYKWGVA